MATTNEELVEEFRRKFADENLWRDESGETAFVAIGNIEDWFRQALATKDAACEERMREAKLAVLEELDWRKHQANRSGFQYSEDTVAWYEEKIATLRDQLTDKE